MKKVKKRINEEPFTFKFISEKTLGLNVLWSESQDWIGVFCSLRIGMIAIQSCRFDYEVKGYELDQQNISIDINRINFSIMRV